MKHRKTAKFIFSLIMILSLALSGAVTATAEPTGDFVSAQINVAEDFTLHVTAYADDEITTPTMRFVGAGRDMTVDGVKRGGFWRFSFPKIFAQYMADDFTIQLKNGGTVLQERDFSIVSYFSSIYNSTASELGLSSAQFTSLKTFMADMLEFGAAAQVYVEHGTDNLANSAAWVASSKTAGYTAPTSVRNVTFNAGANDRFTAASVRVENYVRLQFMIKATNADRVKIRVGSNSPFTYMLESAESDGLYHILTDGIMAINYGDVWTLTLTDADDTDYSTVTYSVNSYIVSKDSSTIPGLADIVRAMYNYGASAKAYSLAIGSEQITLPGDGGILDDGITWGDIL